MTFYNEQIIKIKNEFYHKEYLYEQVIPAKQFIETHFSEAITLGDIAYEARFSKFHFMRLFKSIYGQTPHQYLTTVRIEKAKLLLQAGATITEACFSVGFDSVSSFKGLFKRCTNSTPGSYKLQRRKLNQEILGISFGFWPISHWEKSNFQDGQQKIISELSGPNN